VLLLPVERLEDRVVQEIKCLVTTDLDGARDGFPVELLRHHGGQCPPQEKNAPFGHLLNLQGPLLLQSSSQWQYWTIPSGQVVSHVVESVPSGSFLAQHTWPAGQ
jgi:hypothetical protein